MPGEALFVSKNARWEKLGCRQQNQACYVTCNDNCAANAKADAARHKREYRGGVGGAKGLAAATGSSKSPQGKGFKQKQKKKKQAASNPYARDWKREQQEHEQKEKEAARRWKAQQQRAKASPIWSSLWDPNANSGKGRAYYYQSHNLGAKTRWEMPQNFDCELIATAANPDPANKFKDDDDGDDDASAGTSKGRKPPKERKKQAAWQGGSGSAAAESPGPSFPPLSKKQRLPASRAVANGNGHANGSAELSPAGLAASPAGARASARGLKPVQAFDPAQNAAQPQRGRSASPPASASSSLKKKAPCGGASPSPRPAKQAKKPATGSGKKMGSKPAEEFTVERLLAIKGEGANRQYLVKWHGWGKESDNTWELAKNLRDNLSEYEGFRDLDVGGDGGNQRP